jgi:hypothetical protein
MEYLNGFSLQDTVENTGCLSECLLRNVTLQIIDSLEEHLELLGNNYGEISLCDVVFNKHGLIKVRLGIKQAPSQYLQISQTKLPRVSQQSEMLLP